MHSSATDIGGEGGVIQSPPTRWHVLFSVLVSADSINRRDGSNGGCSPPCFPPPFLSFSLPPARISRAVCPSVRPFLASLLAITRAGSRFILTTRGTRVSAELSQGHVSRRALIALPISTRARSRTTLLTIGIRETRDQLGTLEPLRGMATLRVMFRIFFSSCDQTSVYT